MITIVLGNTSEAALDSYKTNPQCNTQRPYTFLHTTTHPAELKEIALNIANQAKTDGADLCVLTHSLFLIRAVYLAAKKLGTPVQFLFGETFSEDFPQQSNLIDYELAQSDEYIDWENTGK